MVTSCDRSNDETETTVKKLHISEFQKQANFWTMNEAEELIKQSVLNKQSGIKPALGITSSTAIVPLVFDEDGYLYEAIKFSQKVEEIIASEDENEMPTIETPPVYFTDFETYAMVSGDMLSLEKRIMSVSENIEGEGNITFYVFDPYRVYDDNENMTDIQEIGTKSIFKISTLPPNATVQVGDVVLGWRTDGSSYGHTGGIVIRQNGQWVMNGGSIYDPETKTMEAVGYRWDWSDEIQLRSASQNFISSNITKLRIKRRQNINFDQRVSVADYQLGKDNCTYSLLTPKW